MDLSIIIPVYNAATVVQKCLDCIIKQSDYEFTFEVIAINDGSTDNSLAILKEYESSFPNLTIIDQKNSGTGAARNAGLDKALGKYIWFMDSDDYIELNAFSFLQKQLFSGQEEHTIGFNYFNVTADGIKKKNIEEDANLSKELIKGADYLCSDKPYYLWVIIYQRSIIEHYHLRFINGIKNLEDLEFSIKYFTLNSDLMVTYYPIMLYNYCHYALSTSRNTSQENLLKLANDTVIVHKSIANYKETKIKEYSYAPIEKIFNVSVMGFFFSLLQYNYKLENVVYFYNMYQKNKFFPQGLLKNNIRFFLFSLLLKSKVLFFPLLFLKKTIAK